MMFQHNIQVTAVTPPSVKTICVSDQSTMSSRSPSPSRTQSPSWPLAAPHTPACSPIKLHTTARIESTFRTIEYVNFRDKPACLIVIDVRFIYNKKYMMRSANIQLNFSKALDGSADDASFPCTTDAYGPTESLGGVESVSTTQSIDISTPKAIAQCGLPTATIGSTTMRTQNEQWHIQGTQQQPKHGPSQSYNWSIFDNSLSSFESFPRAVTLWMIIEHDKTPFYTNMRIDGNLRGHMATNVLSRLSRYCEDKKEGSKTLAPGGFVPDLTADSSLDATSNIWNCLATKRGVDGRLFIPAASTSVILDEGKLQAALGKSTSGVWNDDIVKCIKDESEEAEQAAKSLLHLSWVTRPSLFGIKRKSVAVC